MVFLLDSSMNIAWAGPRTEESLTRINRMMSFGTSIIAAYFPQLEEEKKESPVVWFETFSQASEHVENIQACVIDAPAEFVEELAMEPIQKRISMLIISSSALPYSTMLRLGAEAAVNETVILGPSCGGMLIPEVGILGNMFMHRPIPENWMKSRGHVAIITRGQGMAYHLTSQIIEQDFGLRGVLDLGYSKVAVSMDLENMLFMLHNDPETYGIVLHTPWTRKDLQAIIRAYKSGKCAKPAILMLPEHQFCNDMVDTFEPFPLNYHLVAEELEPYSCSVVRTLSEVKEKMDQLFHPIT